MSTILLNKQLHKQEQRRTRLALKNKNREFLETYKLASLNYNSGNYWNAKFDLDSSLEDQDEMTIEKIKNIASYINNKANLKLLDLGIGQGYLEQYLSNRGTTYKLYGIDISETAVSRLKKKFHGEFIVDDILNIDRHYKENYFDVIVAIEVIEHISPPRIFKLYKKVYKLLKSEGLFIISTPLNEGLSKMKDNPSAHVREYTMPILKKEFEIAGFRVVNKKELYAFKSFYKLKKIIALLFKRWRPNNVTVVIRKKYL